MAKEVKAIFRHPRVGTFFQTQPKLENPFLGDGFLQRILTRLLPAEVNSEVSKDLNRFGERIRDELEELSNECEASPPYLVQTDPWGKRTDKVVTCEAWRRMKQVAAEEGIVAIGYERKYSQYSRIHQFAKTYLYSPSSGLYTCPLAMTDGAAKTIEALQSSPLDFAYRRLISRNPSEFWTSGQWMTERKGGSDVGSGTETVAVPDSDGKYYLYGYKWFSSATDSDMTFTLARIVDENGQWKQGSGGLSMFFVKTRRDDGSLNNIQVMKLKNKLGTRQLPTGELLLDGTEATLASEPGRGVANISNMLTITRIHNALASVAGMRRIVSLARDYSKRRTCFGVEICKYPLHVNTLAALELETRAGFILLFEVIRLLGASECKVATPDEEQLLRLFNPIIKLYTGKKCIGVISEGLEAFGGQGYIEDTGLPRILRDAQVTPIWEGTTNILSLDVLRAIGKSKGEVLVAFNRNIRARLEQSVKIQPQVSPQAKRLLDELADVLDEAKQVREDSARILAFSIAEITIGTLLIEHGVSKAASPTDMTAARRWVHQMARVKERFASQRLENFDDSNQLVFDSYADEQ